MTVEKFNMFVSGFCAASLMWFLLRIPKDMPSVVVGIMVILITFLGTVNFMIGLKK